MSLLFWRHCPFLNLRLLQSYRPSQLRLVWASPDPRLLPRWRLEPARTVNASTCPAARPLVATRPDTPAECGVDAGAMCPTNTCCGGRWKWACSPATNAVDPLAKSFDLGGVHGPTATSLDPFLLPARLSLRRCCF